jgi:hypothetical protein
MEENDGRDKANPFYPNYDGLAIYSFLMISEMDYDFFLNPWEPRA